MAESHVVAALITKRAEPAGLIEHHRKEMQTSGSRPGTEVEFRNSWYHFISLPERLLWAWSGSARCQGVRGC